MEITVTRETEVFFREVEKAFNLADLVVGRTMMAAYKAMEDMGHAMAALDWPDELKEFRRKV